MFFCGAQFQRNEHGGCTLLSRPTLPNDSANLSTLGVITPAKKLIPPFWTRAVIHYRQWQKLQGSSDRDPVDVTRSTFLATRSERRRSVRLQPAPRRSPPFELSLGERLKQINQPTRQDQALRRQGANGLVPQGAPTKDSCGLARVSDLCQASTGESYSVS